MKAITWSLIAAIAIPLAAGESELIEEIRKDYARIEAEAAKKEVFTFESETGPEEGKLTRYALDGKVVKIHITFLAGDHGGSDESYYYRDGKLFFGYKADSFWRFSGKRNPDGSDASEDHLHEYRVYVNSGDVIRALEKHAVSEKPEELKAAAAKAKNQELTDKDLIETICQRGEDLFQIENTDQWVDYFDNMAP